jgi:hypothetical protein
MDKTPVYIPYIFVAEPNFNYMETPKPGESADYNPKSFAGCVSLDIENNKPSIYTEIGKDGIIVFTGNTLLTCNTKEVEMRADKERIGLAIPKFYGFKVTPTGIYYNNGSANYKKMGTIDGSGTLYLI